MRWLRYAYTFLLWRVGALLDALNTREAKWSTSMAFSSSLISAASDWSPPYPSWRPAVAIGSAIPRSEPLGGHPLPGLPPWIVVSVKLLLIFGLVWGCLPLASFGPPRVFYFSGALHI